MNKIKKLSSYLEICKNEIDSLDTLYAKVKYIFDKYTQKVYFDTTSNFLNRKLIYEVEEAVDVILDGYGCNCQEIYFVFKELLKYFGISSRIVHGDVYDYEIGLLKYYFTTAIIVEDSNNYIHIDLLKNNFINIDYDADELFIKDDIVIDNSNEQYYMVKYMDCERVCVEDKIYRNSDEKYRVKRLQSNYGDICIMPFGIISPFYWTCNPDRKIFYQLFKDKIRIYNDGKYKDFDVLDWSSSEESNWLTKEQKLRVNRCVSTIGFDIDNYSQISFIERNFDFISKE